MTTAIFEFVFFSGIVVVAAIYLTRYSDRFARATGFGHLLVGSVLLAGATSLPELSMNWAIIRLELPDMAIGGLIGSSLFNLAILAIADLAHKARGLAFSRKSMENSLPGVISIAMTAVVGIGIFIGNQLGSMEFLGVGIFAYVLLLTYLIGLRLIYHDQNVDAQKKYGDKKPVRDKRRSREIINSTTGYLVCAVIIIIVAPQAANAADEIASGSGLGDTFIGTTIVALATSLPELVACIAAVRIGAMNLAIGNVFGSNILNMLLLIPLDIIHPGSLLGSVTITHVLTCMFVVLVTATVIVGQLYRVESRKLLVEPDAALVLILVTISLVLIYFCK